VCDILSEVVSTLFKIYSRLLDQEEYLREQIKINNSSTNKYVINNDAADSKL
jgi:hypothetical protein